MNLNSMPWAREEFEGVNLGDVRLNKRLLGFVESHSKSPDKSINQTSGDWKNAKGAYRLFGNDKVRVEDILLPHLDSTSRRMIGQEVIVVAQDTTFVNYTAHPKTSNLGIAARIGGKDGGAILGVHFHAGLAMTEQGTPLGLVYHKIWNRYKKHEKPTYELKRPINEKESYRWLECLETVKGALPSGARAVVVGDRESDIYEYFERAIDLEIDVVARVSRNRIIETVEGEELNIYDDIGAQKSCGQIEIDIPSNGSRKARKAIMSLKYKEIVLKSNVEGEIRTRGDKRTDLEMTIIQLEEIGPSDQKDKLLWRLLTTLKIENKEDAIRVMNFYKMRWSIELYFKSLKTGCGVEKCRLDDSSKLSRFIAICAVLAWRLMWLTRINKEDPTGSGEVLISETEWKVLWVKTNKEKIKQGLMAATAPKNIPEVRTVIRMIAGLGGFLNRKGDGEPGMITIYRGMISVMEAAEVYEILENQ